MSKQLHILLFLSFFMPFLLNSMDNNAGIWIQTSDNTTKFLDLKKDLPGFNALKYMLTHYQQQFGHYNSEQTPVKLAQSSADITLFSKASRALKNDCDQFQYSEKQQMRLLELALTFKSLRLYTALLGNCIPNQDGFLNVLDVNHFIAQKWLLLDSTNQAQTPQEECVQKTINQMMQLNNQQEKWDLPLPICSTHDKKYYIKDNFSNNVYIYDARTKIMIKSFPDCRRKSIISTKNCVLFWNNQCEEKPQLVLYNIEEEKNHIILCKSSTDPVDTQISPNENHIAACYHNSIFLWDISNPSTIHVEQATHAAVDKIIFSPDTNFLISYSHSPHPTSAMKFWRINNSNLECIKTFNNAYATNLLFGITAKNIVHKQKDTLSLIKIEYTENNDINMTTLLTWPAALCTYNPFIIAVYTREIEKLTLFSTHGRLIHSCTVAPSNVNIKQDGTAITLFSRQQQPTTIHLTRNNNDFFYKSTTTIFKYCPWSMSYNKDKNNPLLIFYYPFGMTLCDIYGNHIKAWQDPQMLTNQAIGPAAAFHPDGNAIIHNTTLYPLYDLDTKPQLTKLTNRLTIGQYALLKKVCNKKRSTGEYMTIKPNSLNHHLLESLKKDLQQLIAEKLYLKTSLKNQRIGAQ